MIFARFPTSITFTVSSETPSAHRALPECVVCARPIEALEFRQTAFPITAIFSEQSIPKVIPTRANVWAWMSPA